MWLRDFCMHPSTENRGWPAHRIGFVLPTPKERGLREPGRDEDSGHVSVRNSSVILARPAWRSAFSAQILAPAHTAGRADRNSETALLSLCQQRSAGRMCLACTVAPGDCDRPRALNFEVIMIDGVRVEDLHAKAGTGIVHLNYVKRRAAVVFNRGFDECRTARGNTKKRKRRQKQRRTALDPADSNTLRSHSHRIDFSLTGRSFAQGRAQTAQLPWRGCGG